MSWGVVTLDGVTIEDLHSKNGTFVNGRRIEEATALTDGNEVALGSVRLRVRISSRDDTTKTPGPGTGEQT